MSDHPSHVNPANTDHDETAAMSEPENRKARSSWKGQQQVLPENRLGIVFSGLMCCTFLAALDQVHAIHIPS